MMTSTDGQRLVDQIKEILDVYQDNPYIWISRNETAIVKHAENWGCDLFLEALRICVNKGKFSFFLEDFNTYITAASRERQDRAREQTDREAEKNREYYAKQGLVGSMPKERERPLTDEEREETARKLKEFRLNYLKRTPVKLGGNTNAQ